MLSLVFESGKAYITNGEVKLIDNITLEINYFSGKKAMLTPTESVEGELRFCSSNGADSLYLSLKSIGSEAVLRVRGGLGHYAGCVPTTFAQNNSVIMRFDSIKAEGVMANYQYSEWWTRPSFGQSSGELCDRTLSALFKLGDSYAHFYPLCDDVYRTCLVGEGETTVLSASIRCGGHDKINGALMSIAVGDDPYKTVQSAVKFGLNSTQNPVPTKEDRRDIDALDLLGWCTYDAFYSDVTHDKIITKLKEFKEKNLPVKMMIIDAGWFGYSQDENGGKIVTDLKADPVKFPQGLKALVDEAKADYGIEKIGIWHAISGTWHGIKKGSPAYEQTKDYLLELSSFHCYPSLERDKAFGFFDCWHSYLKGEGIDFIKTDFQGMTPMYASGIKNVNCALKDLHAGFEASASLHFDGNVINCMGMAQEVVQSRPKTGVSRNSDDFFPKKELGFSEHFLQNAYNAIYHGVIYHCDFDMWWTEHWSSHQNALLRAVSGGPIYTSDPIGQTNPTELMRLSDKNGFIYECDRVGTVCRDNLFSDPSKDETLAKMFNLCRDSAVVAAFNIDLEGRPVSGCVKPTDAEGVVGERFLSYLWGKDLLTVVEKDEGINLTLNKDDGDIAIFTPIIDGFALLGILDKYITSDTILVKEDNFIILREGGRLAFYSDTSVKSVTADGVEVSFTHLGDGIYTADIPLSDDEICVVIA